MGHYPMTKGAVESLHPFLCEVLVAVKPCFRAGFVMQHRNFLNGVVNQYQPK